MPEIIQSFNKAIEYLNVAQLFDQTLLRKIEYNGI